MDLNKKLEEKQKLLKEEQEKLMAMAKDAERVNMEINQGLAKQQELIHSIKGSVSTLEELIKENGENK